MDCTRMETLNGSHKDGNIEWIAQGWKHGNGFGQGWKHGKGWKYLMDWEQMETSNEFKKKRMGKGSEFGTRRGQVYDQEGKLLL